MQLSQDLRNLTKLCHSEPSDSEVKNLQDASLQYVSFGMTLRCCVSPVSFRSPQPPLVRGAKKKLQSACFFRSPAPTWYLLAHQRQSQTLPQASIDATTVDDPVHLTDCRNVPLCSTERSVTSARSPKDEEYPRLTGFVGKP